MPRVVDLVETGLTPLQAKHLGAQAILGDFNALTAAGNNSQADAYQIEANYNIFTTVGATTNSAKLPIAESDPHGIYYVLNLGANALNLFPAVGDNFNNLAANTAISIGVNLGVILVKQTTISWQVQRTYGATSPVILPINLATQVTGVLPEANGGTNQSTYAQGDLLYASAANTLAKLAKSATATRYLANTGASNNPNWDQINLANGVTGVLPVANGGTGGSSAMVTRQVLTSISLNTTTSTSIISMTETDVSVEIATGDIVHITIHGSFSHSNVGATGRYLIRRDTTDLMTETQIFTPYSSTDGLRTGFSVTIADAPTAGTYTYRLGGRTNTGTLYTQARAVTILKIRTQ